MKQRIIYIDILKVVAIFFVTWGHTLSQFGTYTQFVGLETDWIFSFHMPLFAVLSGMCFSDPADCGLWKLVWKKTKALLIPNMTWCFLFYIAMHGAYMCLQLILDKNEIYQGNLLLDWWNALCVEGWWFLRALFLVYLYAILSIYITRYLMRQNDSHIMLIAGLGSTIIMYVVTLFGIIPNHPQPLIGAIYLYPFVWTGVAIRLFDACIEKHLKNIFVVCALLWAIGLCFWRFSYTFYGMNTSIFATSGPIVGMDVAWITLYRYIIGVVSSIAIICLVRLIFGNKAYGVSKTLDRIADIGKCTLFIYVAPSFFFHAIKERVVFENEIISFIFCTLTSIAIVIACYWMAKVVERCKWSRRLLLGIWK